MHEASLIHSLLSMAIDHARADGAARIATIGIRVGELSGVVADALKFAFDAATIEGSAKGSVLEIEYVPARVRCASCRTAYHPAEIPWTCPECSAIGGDLVGGRELELSFLEVM
ncbi:MAG: hydrogenase maturation nickel metallochaperone HypA [Isosphaeraceae bacterium]|nr:hydrogenase maturation nickel metallochaperone HypA [Isosphaeraceae bacterium]